MSSIVNTQLPTDSSLSTLHSQINKGMEVSSQFEIAEELGYISADERLSMDKLIEEVARLLSGLRNSFQPSTSN